MESDRAETNAPKNKIRYRIGWDGIGWDRVGKKRSEIHDGDRIGRVAHLAVESKDVYQALAGG